MHITCIRLLFYNTLTGSVSHHGGSLHAGCCLVCVEAKNSSTDESRLSLCCQIVIQANVGGAICCWFFLPNTGIIC